MMGVSWTAARNCASRSVPRKQPATNSTRARLRLTTSSASWPVNRVLTGTSVPPAPSVPSAASTQWCVFGDQMATRSPGPIPAAISARLTTVACSCRSRQLSRGPPGSVSAGAAAYSPAARASAAGMVVSSTRRLLNPMSKQVLGRLSLLVGTATGQPPGPRELPVQVDAADEEFRAAIASWLAEHLAGRFAGLRGAGGPGREHEAHRRAGGLGAAARPRPAGSAWAGRPSTAGAAPPWLSRSSSTRSTPGPRPRPGSATSARSCSGRP